MHNQPFEVVSSRPLTEGQISYLESAFEEYSPFAAKALSQGKFAEPPVRIIAVPKSDWFQFPRYFQSGLIEPFLPKNHLDYERAMYQCMDNQLFLDIERIPNLSPEEAVKKKYPNLNWLKVSPDSYQQLVDPFLTPRREMMHEFAHAIDDFGSQEIVLSPLGPFEIGRASQNVSLFPYQTGWVDLGSALYLGNYFSIDQTDSPVEWFAAIAACQHDKYRDKRGCVSPNGSMTGFATAVQTYLDGLPDPGTETWRGSWIDFSF